MALQVNVSSGKQETGRAVGLVRRAENEGGDKHGQVSITEFVDAVFSQVRATLEKEADVEVEITANVDISVKDGTPTLTLDVSGESANARTLRLKFSTRLNPQDAAKEAAAKEAKEAARG